MNGGAVQDLDFACEPSPIDRRPGVRLRKATIRIEQIHDGSVIELPVVVARDLGFVVLAETEGSGTGNEGPRPEVDAEPSREILQGERRVTFGVHRYRHERDTCAHRLR